MQLPLAESLQREALDGSSGSGHAAIPQFMDVDKQMEFFIVQGFF